MFVYNKNVGTNSFNRTYEEYISGFGDVGAGSRNEFFIGLDRLHVLTNGEPHEVIVFDGEETERCDNLIIGNRREGYMLKSIGKCTGESTLPLQQYIEFSAIASDKNAGYLSCLAEEYGYAWWFTFRCVF